MTVEKIYLNTFKHAKAFSDEKELASDEIF